jgi:cell division protein FtsL
VVPLVKAVQEQQQQISPLSKTVQEQQHELDTLKRELAELRSAKRTLTAERHAGLLGGNSTNLLFAVIGALGAFVTLRRPRA